MAMVIESVLDRVLGNCYHLTHLELIKKGKKKEERKIQKEEK